MNILVLGSNSDIAMETILQSKYKNYNFFLISKNEKVLKQNIEILINNKINIQGNFALDLNDFDQIKIFIENLNFYPDIIFVSSGIMFKNEFEKIEEIIKTNYSGIVLFLEFLTHKYYYNIKQIIVITSVGGEVGKKENKIYGSAKGGLSLYLDGLRESLKNDIIVTNIKLGYVFTKMTSDLNLPKLISSNKMKVGLKINNYFLKNKKNVYLPLYWFFIIFLYRIFKLFKI